MLSLRAQDSNKTFRTRLVGTWMFTNAALAIAIAYLDGLDRTRPLVLRCVDALAESPNELTADLAACVVGAVGYSDMQTKRKQSVYFQFILWSTVRPVSFPPSPEAEDLVLPASSCAQFGLSFFRFLGVRPTPHPS